MILRIDCPVCKKDSYSASVVDFRPCPYCGIVFSGKYGIERRNESRAKKEILSRFKIVGKKRVLKKLISRREYLKIDQFDGL